MRNDLMVKVIFWKDIFLDWGVILACFILMAHTESLWIDITAIIIIGIEQYRLAILFHDLGHCTIFKKRKHNLIGANLLVGWWMGIDIAGFNRFHLSHHANLNSKRDIELREGKGNPFAKGINRWTLPISKQKVVFWFLFEIVFGPLLYLLLYIGFKVRFNDDGTQIFCWRECVGTTILMATVSLILWKFDLLWVFWVWLLALGFVFYAFFNLRIVFEHLGCAKGETIPMSEPVKWYEWLYAITSGAHNIRYHVEHHYNATVPYMLLPQKRKENLESGMKTIDLNAVLTLLSTSPAIDSGEPLEKTDDRSFIYRMNKI